MQSELRKKAEHLQQQNITMLSTFLTKAPISVYAKKEKLTKILGAGRSKHHHSFYYSTKLLQKRDSVTPLKLQQGDP
jgi:hypothetical protein